MSLEAMWSPHGVHLESRLILTFFDILPGVHLESLESTWSLPEPVGQCKVLGIVLSDEKYQTQEQTKHTLDQSLGKVLLMGIIMTEGS